MEDFIIEYLNQKNMKAYKGVALVGSYAQGTATAWSDVDLVFITTSKKAPFIEIVDHHYFTSRYYTTEELELYLKEPDKILNGLKAFSNMKIIYDPENLLAGIKASAEAFTWTSVQIEKCKYNAKQTYLGYLEEAQKALQGLKEHHSGKMLNGLYGLSYGMFQVIRLRDQLMTSSDNEFYDVVFNNLDDRDPIKELAPLVFNIKSGQLEDQVEAGLEIYMHVGNSMMSFLNEDEKNYAMRLVQEIIKEI